MNPKILIALVIAAALVATPALVYATAVNLNSSKSNIVETQAISTEHLTSDLQQVSGAEYTPRWGPVVDVDANSPMVLFADCEPGEYAESDLFIFPTSDIVALQSFPIAYPSGDQMTWLTVVENTGDSKLPVSNGVTCVDESGKADSVNLDDNTKTTINNVVKQSIKIVNNQIVNIAQLIQIHQNITQIANNIVNITGNNNTVTQIINQSATNILNQNATSGPEITQIINQTAQQEAAIAINEKGKPAAVEAPINDTTTSEAAKAPEERPLTEEETTTEAAPPASPPETVTEEEEETTTTTPASPPEEEATTEPTEPEQEEEETTETTATESSENPEPEPVA
jgi:hypothetical protein